MRKVRISTVVLFTGILLYISITCLLYFLPIKAEFITRVSYVKEKMSLREREVWGRWMTEDRMRKSNEFSPASIKAIMNYCSKFPESLIRQGFARKYTVLIHARISLSYITLLYPEPCPCRQWKYDEKVAEYYVVLEEKTSQKNSEIERSREETTGEETLVLFR